MGNGIHDSENRKEDNLGRERGPARGNRGLGGGYGEGMTTDKVLTIYL